MSRPMNSGLPMRATAPDCRRPHLGCWLLWSAMEASRPRSQPRRRPPARPQPKPRASQLPHGLRALMVSRRCLTRQTRGPVQEEAQERAQDKAQSCLHRLNTDRVRQEFRGRKLRVGRPGRTVKVDSRAETADRRSDVAPLCRPKTNPDCQGFAARNPATAYHCRLAA